MLGPDILLPTQKIKTITSLWKYLINASTLSTRNLPDKWHRDCTQYAHGTFPGQSQSYNKPQNSDGTKVFYSKWNSAFVTSFELIDIRSEPYEITETRSISLEENSTRANYCDPNAAPMRNFFTASEFHYVTDLRGDLQILWYIHD
jgi:hypothetical protein